LLRPSWRVGLAERLGAFPEVAGASPVWLHGASVGEVRVAARLAAALAAEGTPAVGSATTLAGRAAWRALAPGLPSGFAPLDHPWSVARALERARPSLLALVETELWPCWIQGAAERGVRVAIVSARVSERSFSRYARVRPLVARVLARVAAIGARSEGDAERFVALGAPPERVSVTGDLKLEPESAAAPLASDLAAALGDAPLLVFGSTHAPEEEAALGALAASEAAALAAALVLAPRRSERAREIAGLMRGRRVVLRSALDQAPLRAGDVLVLDTLGELPALWPRATLAFVGGTLAPGVGGHNLLEPAQCGRFVLFGPHGDNVRAAAELLRASGGGARVADAAELARVVVAALRERTSTAAAGAAGRSALVAHRGALTRTLALLRELRR
jgi:3-deoxy-D-manno-octulosonic-acid transferase